MGSRNTVRKLALAAVGVVVTTAMPAAAQASELAAPLPPPTLTGEVLQAEPIQAERGCPSGSFTRTFTATGDAIGPYPGTFTESGTITIDPPTTPSFSATFTITSGTTTITGTKTGTGAGVPSGVCENPIQYSAFVTGTYNARIDTGSGVFDDRGTHFVNFIVNDIPLPSPNTTHDFTEGFASDLAAPILEAPTSSDQCKNGGFKNYPALGFKNQGDCVSFVATRGKNPPAGQ